MDNTRETGLYYVLYVLLFIINTYYVLNNTGGPHHHRAHRTNADRRTPRHPPSPTPTHPDGCPKSKERRARARSGACALVHLCVGIVVQGVCTAARARACPCVRGCVHVSCVRVAYMRYSVCQHQFKSRLVAIHCGAVRHTDQFRSHLQCEQIGYASPHQHPSLRRVGPCQMRARFVLINALIPFLDNQEKHACFNIYQKSTHYSILPMHALFKASQTRIRSME